MRRTTLFAIAALASLLWTGFPSHASIADTGPTVVPRTLVQTELILAMRITAYASVPEETDDTPFITANGTFVHDGIVASNILPFGTKIQIPALFGSKVFTVEDRTNRRIKNTIDIWMSSKTKALRFGANNASVVVLDNETSSAISEAAAKGKVTF
jgi:3D (Asp-Asp-Asp) domain-containing protein